MPSSSALLPSPASDRSHSSIDCRVYERKACEVPTTCQPAIADDSEPRWEATITDISQGGVRLNLHRRFERGAALAIELPGDGKRESTVVLVKVVHIRAQADGTWGHGCKFLNDLSADDVHRLVTAESYVLAPRRGEGRPLSKNDFCIDPKVHASDDKILALTNVQIFVELHRGATRRFFVRRLDIAKCWPVTAGLRLRIRGRDAVGLPWAFQIQVTHIHREGDDWTLRARLAPGAPMKDLLRAWTMGASNR